MTLPPFPSQDLAKLVLGYLAEEHLMTVYDEFLQASPYLDAFRNEYDRMFMTSLKSILAEYRAVKIYVDTCSKPLVLRKKIFQCSNLLEIVKFLVSNVDVHKIQFQETADKGSSEKQNITNVHKRPSEVPLKEQEDVSASHLGTHSSVSSVETTPLEDLPGSHVTKRKKKVKLLKKDSPGSSFMVNSVPDSDSIEKQSFSSNNTTKDNFSKCSTSSESNNAESLKTNITVKAVDPSKSAQNIDEFNDVLKSVVNRNKTVSGSESLPSQRISTANNFQDFADGISSGENKSASYSVPDSSTSENINVKVPLTKGLHNTVTKVLPKCQLLLKVSQVNDCIDIKSCTGDPKILNSSKHVKILPKTAENKIKIISDIKVGNKYNEQKDIPIKNATSTPLMHMQKIVINGTSAYKHSSKQHTYTKDEIMAMPTLIVVPAPAASQILTSAKDKLVISPSNDVMSKVSPPKVLGPLVIDVPSNVMAEKTIFTDLPNLTENSLETGLVKTVDLKNQSAPKDNIITLESNTPNVVPPKRKSSSTPRRTSHVRVLEFTTPRRILHETINEHATSESPTVPVEVVVNSEPDTITIQTPSENNILESDSANNLNTVESNENDNIEKPSKKNDWDADLRALIGSNEINSASTSRRLRTSRKKSRRLIESVEDDNDDGRNKSRNKKSTKTRKSKVKQKENENIPEQKKDIPMKPTINIVCGHKHSNADLQESKNLGESSKNKPEEDVQCLDTPETERLSLQNVIGARLDISNLLETPYKQALYDIQMETPKFIGPDLGEPLSDIKIMSIPTPLIFDTPKLVQDTPYSSRPTDYSSGGSYYKPDDQDYNINITEAVTCPVTSTNEDSIEKISQIEHDEKKSRPVRQCAKNVSYYRHCITLNRAKDSEYVIDASSSCSDTNVVNSSWESKNKKEPATKIPKRDKSHQSSTDTQKSKRKGRKTKTPKDPAKEKSKSFMKIKPRYTPKKESPSGRIKKRTPESPHFKVSPNVNRKKKSSKHKIPSPQVTAMPTKSRRKSSTPRKLHCTKQFNSESSGNNSPTIVDHTAKSNVNRDTVINAQDSNTEEMNLRWSDDGSQDDKLKTTANISANDIEDINKIKEFIDSSDVNKHSNICEKEVQKEQIAKHDAVDSDGALQRDLMKRGFDLETAKIIERDLLDDTPLRTEITNKPVTENTIESKSHSLEKTVETGSSNTAELAMVEDEKDEDEVEFSVYECVEESSNYFVLKHDDTKEIPIGPPVKLKDKFTMEVCIDDGLTVRLQATAFNLMLDQDPVDEIDYSYKETERAVSSICNIERLYTPLKDSVKAQVYEIFDSTLTSIDTPLKSKSPLKVSETVTSLVLEESKEAKVAKEAKRRKRLQSSSDESISDSKRVKQDADILFKTANIQNIDIESVLTKLHGP